MDPADRHFEILNRLQTGIVVHAPDTRIMFANPRACQLLGLSPDQLRGNTVTDLNLHFVDEADQPLPPASLPVQRVIDSGEAITGLVLGVKTHTLTQTVWLQVSAFAQHDAAGQLAQVVVDFHDITQCRLAEQQHVAHEAFVTVVLDSLSEHIAVIDKEANIVAVNRAWCQFAGANGGTAELQSSIGISYFCNINVDRDAPNDDLELASFAGIRDVLSGTRSHFNLEYPCHSQTEKRWFRMTVTPLGGSHGGAVISHHNITERHQIELQAQHSTELLHSSIEAIDEAFVIFDANERLVFCNEKYRQLNPQMVHLIVPGVAFETLIRHGASIGFYLESVGRVEEWVAERLTAYRAGNQTCIQHLSTGRVVRAIERKMADGHTVGFRIDITELISATEAALAASRVKGQFLATMSHEIRTPMNAILGMLHLLQNTKLTGQQLDYARKAESASQSLLGLINNVLDFSKVEAGKMDLDIHAFRLDRLLRDLAVILSASVAGKHIDVLFNIDARLPEVVLGDAGRLRQVLINLGNNAVKFTASGQVVIAMRLLSLVSDVAHIEFSVEDTGIGIAAANQQHIFDGFSQAEASTTRKFGGTGLGLAICQRLVKLMGGTLGLTSLLGAGTRFAFVLQLATVIDIPAELIKSPRPDNEPRQALVIEDNPLAAELTLRLAKSWGWGCEWAATGKQAMALVGQRCRDGQFPFDVIFLDCQIPGTDAWGIARTLRQSCRDVAAQQPVIVMISALGREALANRTQEEQSLVNAFLVRPVTASMLFNAALDQQFGRADLRKTQRVKVAVRRLDKLRLLVVEDNLINQQVAEELLIAEGAWVSLAANGKLGVEAVASAKEPFDAVLMDIQMPVMDGYTATREIRQGLGLTKLPIIAMTANALESDRLECLAAGMNEHVGKPFEIAHLAAVIRRLTDR